VNVLVLADIHANGPALEAVLKEPHDAVVCLGDLVGFGPDPERCITWARANARVLVLGDHDRAVAGASVPAGGPSYRRLAAMTASIAADQLLPEDIGFLNSLPARAHCMFDGVQFMAVHGTPSNPFFRFLEADEVAWIEEVRGLKTDVLLVGHTHLQFQLTAGRVRVVNPGSVGQPLDGDPRAAYAVIRNGQVEMRRVPYAVEQAITELSQANGGPDAVRASAALWRSGRLRDMVRALKTHDS
jgi:putative phosphoesterase